MISVSEVNGLFYWDSHHSCICLQIKEVIYNVLTADTVVTGKVNYYNCVVHLCSLPWLVEVISQGYNNTAQQPLAYEEGTCYRGGTSLNKTVV